MKVGVDLVDIDRIRNLRRPERFRKKILTEKERKNQKKADTVAGLFAAKEAIMKLLGKGISKISFRDIEIDHDVEGKPKVTLYGAAKAEAYKKGISEIELSISHEKKVAIAVAFAVSSTKDVHLDFELCSLLPARDSHGHKGVFGKVAVIGGSTGMSGSIYMSSMAALRSGSGVVYTVVPRTLERRMAAKSIENIVISVEDSGRGHFTQDSVTEILNHVKDMDAIAIGPGMGRDSETADVVKEILASYPNPVVLDADGLNAIADKPEILLNRKAETVLTPHEMEMSRLVKAGPETVAERRKEFAQEFARRYGVVLLLKGSGTIISDGIETYENATGNSGMATAGSGDVLTGVILSFLGRGVSALTAARIGAYVHGLAGDIFRIERGEDGLIATDLIQRLPDALHKMRRRVEND